MVGLLVRQAAAVLIDELLRREDQESTRRDIASRVLSFQTLPGYLILQLHSRYLDRHVHIVEPDSDGIQLGLDLTHPILRMVKVSPGLLEPLLDVSEMSLLADGEILHLAGYP